MQPLYSLPPRKNVHFIWEGEEYIFLKMDGMYAQVRHTNPETNQKLCDSYGEGTFFCIWGGLLVEVKYESGTS